MATLRFEICKADGRQQFFWHIVTGSDILARSETMFNKADAVSAATKMKNNTAAYEFEVISTKDEDYPFSWHAQAGNGRLLVSSTNFYSTYSGADRAKNFVEANAPHAEIVDSTVASSRW